MAVGRCFREWSSGADSNDSVPLGIDLKWHLRLWGFSDI